MKRYIIYHPSALLMNNKCQEDIEFRLIGEVSAETLNHAFVNSQNDFNEEYEKFGARSTSVGDIIESDGAFNMVVNDGFKVLESIKLSKKK